MVGIYKITSPTGRVYIGQSVNIDKRFKSYKRGYCINQTKLYRSFNKYGIDAHIFEVICECSIEELNALERSYQEQYNVLSRKGLNSKLTGTDDKSGTLSEEVKQKLSKANIGKKVPKDESWRNKLSNAIKGKVRSEETRRKMSESRKGMKYNKRK